MSDTLVKSPMQLKYELDNIKKELATLLTNGKKKKEDSLARLIAYRADLKELDAVMAATEAGYKAYLSLAEAILPLANPAKIANNTELIPIASLPAEPTPEVTDFSRLLVAHTEIAQENEAMRIAQAREVYKTQAGHVIRKTKEIYAGMATEKQQNEAYAELLTNKIKETEEQLQQQLKLSNMGIGL